MSADSRTSSLCCPGCAAELLDEQRCGACGRTFPRRGGVVDYLDTQARSEPARAVTAFYERFPFPGYAPADDASALLARSRRSPFVAELDRAIPPDASVLDCGCGTGQLAAFLCLAAPRRRIVAVDACSASLEAAERFRERTAIENLRLYRADLLRLPLREGAFDVVVSRGVVHHNPDPHAAIRTVARRVAPGGILVLGFYESFARRPHRLRRALSALAGRPIRALDPVLRRADVSEEKKRIWIEDQYRHPLELLLPLPDVVAEVEAQGFEWIRSVPPAAPEGRLFDGTLRPRGPRSALLRLGWALAGMRDADAGLVSVIARRREPAQRVS